jgi:hypothetical protein
MTFDEKVYVRLHRLSAFHKFLCVISFLIFFTGIFKAHAGDEKDSLTIVAKKRANRAALMSAIIPGAGQVYNKKYWKVPIKYAGGAVLYYFIKTNNDEYHKYKEAQVIRNDGDPETIDDYDPQFTNEDLETRKDYYRRNRDLSYILAGTLYVLNIVDAYVDSQLMDFDVSDNLSLKINPGIHATNDLTMIPSLNLVLSLK